jgi:hypothetical protein
MVGTAPPYPVAEASMGKRYSIAVDFDGVLHSYTSPWVDAHVIPDPPVEGAIEWLEAISEDFDVVVFTTRGKTEEGRTAVARWIVEQGYCGHDFEVTAEKPPCLIYLDDRAYRFEGPGTFPTADDVHRARPWNKRTPEAGHPPTPEFGTSPSEKTEQPEPVSPGVSANTTTCECGHQRDQHDLGSRWCEAKAYTDAPLGGGHVYDCGCESFRPANTTTGGLKYTQADLDFFSDNADEYFERAIKAEARLSGYEPAREQQADSGSDRSAVAGGAAAEPRTPLWGSPLEWAALQNIRMSAALAAMARTIPGSNMRLRWKSLDEALDEYDLARDGRLSSGTTATENPSPPESVPPRAALSGSTRPDEREPEQATAEDGDAAGAVVVEDSESSGGSE